MTLWPIYLLSLVTVVLGRLSHPAHAGRAVQASLPTGPDTHSHIALKSILKNTHQSPTYGYPTDLTRNIIPIPVHSHNDYWRDVPFFSALSAGAVSVEADVWLYDSALYVGHDESSLTQARTLDSLYVRPILSVLKRQNPRSRFVDGDTKNGVFDADRSQTLYFFIDLKTDGHATLQAALAALKPLRDAGYLTRVRHNDTLIPGPVTVVFTGNARLRDIAADAERHYFYDAPLARLADPADPANQQISRTIAPIASTDFKAVFGRVIMGESSSGDAGAGAGAPTPFNSAQLAALREQVRVAEQRGIGARYWGAPEWPVRLRNQVWRTLVREGVALLNTDDLVGVRELF